MSVGGSGGADDITNVPDLGDIRGKSGRRKKSAGTEATQKRNREAEGVKESPVDIPKASSADKAKLSVDEKHILQEQAKYIAFTQSKTAAREFSAGAIGGVSGAAIEEARKFLLPGKMLQMSAAQLEVFRAQEKHIRATQGSVAARDFRLKELMGLTDQEIQDVKKFDLPEESAERSLRDTLFGGFSAFGLVQTSIAAFSAGLREANEALNQFVSTAITGTSPQVGMVTGPVKAGLMALPAITTGLGALAGSFTPAGPIAGGALGFLAGGATSATALPFAFLAETFDASIQQLTDSLIGFSPALTTQSALQQVRRIQRQFERSELLGDTLERINESRFEFEEALTAFGDRLILQFGPALEKLFTFLTVWLDEGFSAFLDAGVQTFLLGFVVKAITQGVKAAMFGGGD
jgi:hypothetical protein